MRLTETSSEEASPVSLGWQLVKLALLDDANEGFTRNFAGSPLSLTIFLSLLASGSKEDVLENFLSCLGSKGPLVFMNNGMWVDQRFSVKPAFQDVINRIYKTEVRYVDFEKGSQLTKEVNKWVEEKTKGLIKNMLKGPIGEDRMVVIINAVYFKGVWKRQFDPELTKEDKFYLLNGVDVQVPFMCEYSQQHFYSSFDDFQLVKLPYRFSGDKRRFFMYIFLPKEKNGLRKLIDKFDSDPEFMNQKFKLYEHCVHNLKIPKFKFLCRFSASDNMDQLGFCIPPLSSSEILDTNGIDKDRLVGAVHRSYVEVNEEGTEAAAVESDEDMGCCLGDYTPRPPLNFIADHPFIFMIREDESNIPFFIGAVLNPLLEE
ncbi:hypothetical protein PTKIN_Ptkin11bG0094000 [Pterospermum kingtungense]